MYVYVYICVYIVGLTGKANTQQAKALLIQHISITAEYPVHLGADDHSERKGSAYSYPWSKALLIYAFLTNKLLS